MPEPRPPQICDYEGSTYRTDFWEGQDREYEDRVERIALRRLLPSHGRRLLEIGAGYGRLTDEYAAFDQVVLLDYSLSQLQYAQEHFGESDRFVYVAADVHKLPFRPGVFDAATMIRVIHHIADVPRALAQIRHVLVPEATFILEHANKRNLKAMLRYALRKQEWNPYSHAPVEFVELNFDFHPAYIVGALKSARFQPEKRVPASFFRLGILKKLPTGLLVTLDSLLQYSGLLLTPSIIVKCTTVGKTEDNLDAESLFVCPESGAEFARDGDTLFCEQRGLRFAIRNGIYDFKAPLE